MKIQLPVMISVFVLITMLAAYANVEPPNLSKKSNSSYPPQFEATKTATPPSNEQITWALATCAIVNEAGNRRHDILGGMKRTPANIKLAKNSLSSWWDIHNRQEFLTNLRWIEGGGHRRDFDFLARLLEDDPDKVTAIRLKFAGNPDAENQIALASQYKDEVGQKSIVGWDFSRYIALCGWAYLAGYITENEAWQYIMPAARLLQKTFTSWEDLGRNYIIGREFWSVKQTRASGKEYRRCYEKLLKSSSSPWTKNPWKLDLTI